MCAEGTHDFAAARNHLDAAVLAFIRVVDRVIGHGLSLFRSQRNGQVPSLSPSVPVGLKEDGYSDS